MLTPKTDWVAEDYNAAADFNRQKNNIKYLAAELLPELYYFPAHEEIADFKMGRMPRVSTLNTLEGNIAAIEECGITLPTGWPQTKTWSYPSANYPNYADWNRWEYYVVLMLDMAERMKDKFKPAGTFAAGQTGMLPRRVV